MVVVEQIYERSEGRRPERSGIALPSWGKQIPFSFLLPHFSFLFRFAGPTSRPFGPPAGAQARQVGRRSPSGRTAHPHHACLSAHPGNLPAHRPSAHLPMHLFFRRKKYPLSALRAAFRPFFYEKNTPYGAFLGILGSF